MNILPKKRWHVRTKDNIARVRRDEAEAARLEEEKQRRIAQAEREIRINLLKKAGDGGSSSNSSINNSEKDAKAKNTIIDDIHNFHGHINLFGETTDSVSQTVKDNPEYIKEKKEETEKYEKQIGYLTYLGQDTNEALKLKSWYEKSPEKRKSEIEDKLKNKIYKYDDPIEKFKNVLSKEKTITTTKNQCNEKIDKKLKNKKKTLEEMRAARLEREKSEKMRQEMLLQKFNKKEGSVESNATTVTKPTTTNFRQKYNNQFNPMFARQNM